MKIALQENPFFFNSTERKIVLALFSVLWIFLFVRAIFVPVLHDEIATFFYYIQSDNYLPPSAHWDANNHVLNSMFANISYHIFGSSPLALRLPNVLTYALFFYGAVQIAGRLNKKIIRWGLLLALVASHYLFEYMGECRGYGMSMAFFVMAIFQFIRAKETDKRKYFLYMAIFLFLGTAANLTLIIPSVILFATLFLHTLINHFKTNTRTFFINSVTLLLTGLPFLILVKLSFAFKERGAFYYGGDSGFYDVTVRSLSQVFTDFYNLPIAIGITTLFISFILFLSFKLFKTKSLRFILENSGLFPFLLVTNVVCILILFHKMEVNFPEDRVAMHLFILFISVITYYFKTTNFRLNISSNSAIGTV